MEKTLSACCVILWLYFQWLAGKTQVEQRPKSPVSLQGENCLLQGNYTVNPANNLKWYSQDRGTDLESLAVPITEGRKSQMEDTQQL
ncbi:hypothetical protein LEMLEM_LOCUS20441 [Lemmus lemmus]